VDLRRKIVYAFTSSIPHLRDIYVCDFIGEEFLFLDHGLPWDADKVARDAGQYVGPCAGQYVDAWPHCCQCCVII
jgi:hypothetical protein